MRSTVPDLFGPALFGPGMFGPGLFGLGLFGRCFIAFGLIALLSACAASEN